MKGFSLVEIMVAVAIISIMAVSASVNFGSFLTTIKVQNTVGHVDDIIGELDQEVVTGIVTVSSVYFKPDYLLSDSKTAGATINLAWQSPGGCGPNEIGLKSDKEAQFFMRDAEGELLDTPVRLLADQEFCVRPLEFLEREIIYEVQADSDFSNKVRVFPLDYSLSGSRDVSINPNDYRLDILAPYSRKNRYDDVTLLDDTQNATITIKSADDERQETFDLPKNS